jgi:toxic protein SymE
MLDYIVITTQNTRELWDYANGLRVAPVNRKKMMQWLETFPGALNDTGDMPVYKCGDGPVCKGGSLQIRRSQPQGLGLIITG